MKIIVYPDDGGSPVTLGDDSAGALITAELPSQARLVTPVPLYGANFQKVFSGGNRLNSFSFQTERAHGTGRSGRAAAVAFKFAHADAVPLSGVVEINQEELSRWLDAAVIPEVRCVKHNGVSTIFAYTVLGGKFMLQNPNTGGSPGNGVQNPTT